MNTEKVCNLFQRVAASDVSLCYPLVALLPVAKRDLGK
jgi:hypothetical protein